MFREEEEKAYFFIKPVHSSAMMLRLSRISHKQTQVVLSHLQRRGVQSGTFE